MTKFFIPCLVVFHYLLLIVVVIDVFVVSVQYNTNYDNDEDDYNNDDDNDNEPIHVYLLSGQSNMVGYGSIDHMDILVNCTTDTMYRDTIWDDDTNTYRSRDDVIMNFFDSHGPLTISRTTNYAGEQSFGPELMFGWTIGDYYKQKYNTQHSRQQQQQQQSKQQQQSEQKQKQKRPNIILVKVAWGGKDLAKDYRPPRSGEGSYPNIKPSFYGWEYRNLIYYTLQALDQINQTYYSSSTATTSTSSTFVVKGFVWFQGWNDMLDSKMVDEYSFNLANFIRDVRDDLSLPNLPFVIGELGMHGLNLTGQPEMDRVLSFRAAQKYVTEMYEFRSSTLFVPTAQYAIVNDTITYNGIHHYYGRADTYYHIGQAFGTGMIQLLSSTTTSSSSSNDISIHLNNISTTTS